MDHALSSSEQVELIGDEGTCGPGANRAAGGRGKAHPVAPPNPFRLLGQCRAPLPYARRNELRMHAAQLVPARFG